MDGIHEENLNLCTIDWGNDLSLNIILWPKTFYKLPNWVADVLVYREGHNRDHGNISRFDAAELLCFEI